MSWHPCHQSTAARPLPARGACWLPWALALALWLAPALVRMHEVVHSTAGHVHGPADSERWVLALFAGHGPADCELLDQHSAWAGPPTGGALASVHPPQEPPAAQEQRAVFGGSAAFFDPRAPPTSARRASLG